MGYADRPGRFVRQASRRDGARAEGRGGVEGLLLACGGARRERPRERNRRIASGALPQRAGGAPFHASRQPARRHGFAQGLHPKQRDEPRELHRRRVPLEVRRPGCRDERRRHPRRPALPRRNSLLRDHHEHDALRQHPLHGEDLRQGASPTHGDQRIGPDRRKRRVRREYAHADRRLPANLGYPGRLRHEEAAPSDRQQRHHP